MKVPLKMNLVCLTHLCNYNTRNRTWVYQCCSVNVKWGKMRMNACNRRGQWGPIKKGFIYHNTDFELVFKD